MTGIPCQAGRLSEADCSFLGVLRVQRLDRTQEVGGSSPPSSIRWISFSCKRMRLGAQLAGVVGDGSTGTRRVHELPQGPGESSGPAEDARITASSTIRFAHHSLSYQARTSTRV